MACLASLSISNPVSVSLTTLQRFWDVGPTLCPGWQSRKDTSAAICWTHYKPLEEKALAGGSVVSHALSPTGTLGFGLQPPRQAVVSGRASPGHTEATSLGDASCGIGQGQATGWH